MSYPHHYSPDSREAIRRAKVNRILARMAFAQAAIPYKEMADPLPEISEILEERETPPPAETRISPYLLWPIAGFLFAAICVGLGAALAWMVAP